MAVMSRAATVGPGEDKKEIMVNDVSPAYFYAKCTRCLYVELPKEDPDAHPDYLGRFRLCLYGTRDAALNWQQTLANHLVENGFHRGDGHQEVFHHPTINIWTFVHGDDYCSAGISKSLDWLQTMLEERYEIKTQCIGNGTDGKGVKKSTEGQVLNCVIRFTPGGYELEADLRHAELVIEQLGLESSKAVVTPGIDQEPLCTAWDEEPEGEELPADRA